MKRLLLLLALAAATAVFAADISGTASAGQTETFTVTSDGLPPLSYQWTKNGVKISGATTATLVVANLQVGDSGTYAVNISNAFGAIVSGNAVLTVVAPVTQAPLISLNPISQTVKAGQPVTFSGAANGIPVPTYQWQKSGVSIAGATSASFTIASVSLSDAGSYSLMATNSAGYTISNAATLTVNPAGAPPTTSALTMQAK